MVREGEIWVGRVAWDFFDAKARRTRNGAKGWVWVIEWRGDFFDGVVGTGECLVGWLGGIK